MPVILALANFIITLSKYFPIKDQGWGCLVFEIKDIFLLSWVDQLSHHASQKRRNFTFSQICCQCAGQHLKVREQVWAKENTRCVQVIGIEAAGGRRAGRAAHSMGAPWAQAAHPVNSPVSWCPLLPVPQGILSRPEHAHRRGELGAKSCVYLRCLAGKTVFVFGRWCCPSATQGVTGLDSNP